MATGSSAADFRDETSGSVSAPEGSAVKDRGSNQGSRGRRNPRFHALIAEICDLHDRKSEDYSEDSDPLSNFKRAAKLGVSPLRGVLVRMSDKWSRIEQLTSGKTPKNESLRDSLIDNAVYSLIAVLLLDDEGVQ